MWMKIVSAAKKINQARKVAKNVNESGAGDQIDQAAKKIVVGGVVSGCGTALFALLIFGGLIYILTRGPVYAINLLLGNLNNDSQTELAEGSLGLFQEDSWDDATDETQQEFYDEVEKVAKNAKDSGDTLRVNLLVATLTYSNPSDYIVDDETEEDDESIFSFFSNLVDYKKAKKQVKNLAKKFIAAEKDYLKAKESDSNANYKDYYDDLLNKTIRDYYFEGDKSLTIEDEVQSMMIEIYQRVEDYEEDTAIDTFSSVYSNINVTVTTCDGKIALETVSLYDYVLGILTIEAGGLRQPDEFLKVMSVVGKNFVLAVNRVSPDNMQTDIRIASCENRQIYCSPTKGCHNMHDASPDRSSSNTYAPGPDSNGNYAFTPITDEDALNKYKAIVDETYNKFIISNGSFVTTQYRSGDQCGRYSNCMNQSEAIEMARNGYTYQEILAYFYEGTLEELSLSFSSGGYPVDIKYNTVTSPFGCRFHPVHKTYRMHNGIDISAPADANIYSVADGEVVISQYSSSYGYYVKIGHGEKANGMYEYYSLYAHMIRTPKVSVGEVVQGGQIIGNIGSTGVSTGNHLHFEIRVVTNGKEVYTDPLIYLSNYDLNVNYSGLKDIGLCGG